MGICMRKRSFQVVIFWFFLLALFFPFFKIVFAPSPPQLFNVMVNLGNVAPKIHNITINGNNPPFSFGPIENGTKPISITFNVSDGNGQADIVDSTIIAKLNFTGTTRTNKSACITITTGTNDKYYNCTILFNYFDENATLYDLNVTATDVAGTIGQNVTFSAFTYTILTAIELSQYNITYSTSPGTSNVRPDNDLTIYNRGNDIFRDINITTFDLQAATQVLGASNFTLNITNSTDSSSNLIGNNSVGRTAGGNGTNFSFFNASGIFVKYVNNSNTTIFMSVNVSSSLTEKSFNASQAWVIKVDRTKP